MRRFLALSSLAVLFSAGPLFGADVKEKWLYLGGSFNSEQNVTRFISIMNDAKKSGVTHIAAAEGVCNRPDNAPKEYPEYVQRVLAEAKKLDMKVVPHVYPIGYGGSWLWYDGNLGAGIPARNVPFIVQNGSAGPAPDPDLQLKNGGFENADGDQLANWQQPSPGQLTFVDKEVKHGGNSSLRINGKGTARVSQTFNVKPYQYYRLTVWTKAQDLQADSESFLGSTLSGSKRRPIYANLGVRNNEDWTKHELTFNTFEGGELKFSIGVSDGQKGTLWVDDLTIEPAGLLHVLRREMCPLKVTSEDGATVYEEGKDFKPVADPSVAAKPFNGYRFDHVGPKIELTDNSRIKAGQKLLVSFFHPGRIYGSQTVISIQDPKVFELMDKQAQYMAKVWNTYGYFMKQDEVRAGGYEVQPNGESLTSGQLLARQTKLGYDLIKKYQPSAKVYAWSDMYTPFHNARPGPYYYANGDWTGAWEGLPSDVIIMNWHSPTSQNIKWFADRGHEQVLCGYYDVKGTEGLKKNILNWMKVSEGTPKIDGIMYTTWTNNYANMAEFFKLVDDYPAWAGSTTAESQPEH